MSSSAAPAPGARTSTKMGPGRCPASWVQNPDARLDEQPVVLDGAGRGAARPAAGVHQTRGRGLQVAPPEAAGPRREPRARRPGRRRPPPPACGSRRGRRWRRAACRGATPAPRAADASMGGADGADDPGHGGAEVAQDHARDTPREAESEVVDADRDLDDGEAGAGAGRRDAGSGLTMCTPAADRQGQPRQDLLGGQRDHLQRVGRRGRRDDEVADPGVDVLLEPRHHLVGRAGRRDALEHRRRLVAVGAAEEAGHVVARPGAVPPDRAVGEQRPLEPGEVAAGAPRLGPDRVHRAGVGVGRHQVGHPAVARRAARRMAGGLRPDTNRGGPPRRPAGRGPSRGRHRPQCARRRGGRTCRGG